MMKHSLILIGNYRMGYIFAMGRYTFLDLNDFDSKLIDKRSRNVLSVAEPSMTNTTNVLTVLTFFFIKTMRKKNVGL